MAITTHNLADLLDALAELVPFLRRPSANATDLLWASLPPAVREELTCGHLNYAAEQFLQDPDRPTQLPIHQALLRYLYRCENGLPNYGWGLRQNLHELMGQRGFHALPASQADLAAQHGLPGHDGARHEPGGVLANLQVLPPTPGATALPSAPHGAALPSAPHGATP
jgi:hypothetical protein